MKHSLLLALVALVTVPTFGRAESTFAPSAQIRHRFEVDSRDFDSNTDPRTFSLLRSRVGLDFTPSENIRGFIQLQDSRTFGEETSTLNDGSADNFDLHQGYLEVKSLFEAPIDLKAGRMEVKYGSERLFGAVGWSNIGRSFDGAMFTAHAGLAAIDIFHFAEVESLFVDDIGDQNVFGANVNLDLSETSNTQLLAVLQRKVPSERLNRYTLALYTEGRFGNFKHEAELAYQGGDVDTLNVKAYMATLNLWYTFANSGAKPSLSAGVDLLSGDDDPSDSDFKVFDTLYATNHKFYGYMDYFVNIPVNTFGGGLVDIHGKLSATPIKETSTALAVHFFRSHKDVSLGNQVTSDDFGTEVDLTINHGYTKNLSFTIGASAFVPGQIFDTFVGTSTSTWFYLMTTLNM